MTFVDEDLNGLEPGFFLLCRRPSCFDFDWISVNEKKIILKFHTKGVLHSERQTKVAENVFPDS